MQIGKGAKVQKYKGHWDTMTLGDQDTGTPGQWDTRTPGHGDIKTMCEGLVPTYRNCVVIFLYQVSATTLVKAGAAFPGEKK